MESGVLVTRSACPAVAIAGLDRRRHPVRSREQPRRHRDRRRRQRSPTCAATCDETRRHTSSPTSPSTSRPSRRDAARRARRRPALFRQRACRAAPTSSPRASAGSACISTTASSAPAPAAAGTSQVLRSAATLPEDVRRQITRERKAGDRRRRGRSDGRSRGARRGRPRQLRGAGRLPAHPGPARLQRDALDRVARRRADFDAPSDEPPAAAPSPGLGRVRARERAAGEPAAAEGATAPESLRQKDRAGKTLWKASAAAQAAAGHRRGNRRRPRRGGESSQVPVTEGACR